MAMSAALKEKRAKLREKLQSKTISQLKPELERGNVRGLSTMNKKQMIEAVIALRVGPFTMSKQAKGSKRKYAGAGKGQDWHGEGPFRLMIIKGHNAGRPSVYANLGPYAAARGAIADAKTLLRQAAPVGKYQLSNSDGRPIAEFDYDGVDGYIVQAGPDWRPEDGDPPDLLAVIVQPTTEDGMPDKKALYGADVVGGKTVAKRQSMRLNKGRKNKNVSFTTRSGETVNFKTKKNSGRRNGFDSDQSVATELVLFIDNDSTLYHQQTQPIILNLARKKVKGTFDKKLAPKIFKYLADAGAKKYNRDMGLSSAGYGDFTPDVRRLAAQDLLDGSMEEINDKAKELRAAKKSKGRKRSNASASSLTTTQHAALNSLQYQDSLQDFNPATVESLLRRGLIKKKSGRGSVWEGGNTYSLTAAGKQAPKGGGNIVPEDIYSNPRTNHHLVKGEHVKWSQQGILNVGWAGTHDKGRVTQVTKSGYVVDWGTGKAMPVPDKWLVDARSGSNCFPGSDYEGKTPGRGNPPIEFDRDGSLRRVEALLARLDRASGGQVDSAISKTRKDLRAIATRWRQKTFDGAEEIRQDAQTYDSESARKMGNALALTSLKWEKVLKALERGTYQKVEEAAFLAKRLLSGTHHNPDRWVRGVVKEMEEHGTVGAFTKQARNAGYKSTMEFARKVMDGWRSGAKKVYNKKTRRRQTITMKTMRRANFALNV